MLTLIIKNGKIVDGRGGEAYQADLAVDGNKIVKIAPVIEEETTSIVDAKGCYVTPGLIDHHTHLYPMAPIGTAPEAACFSAGVTTAVDAGSTGCNTYAARRAIIGMTKLRMRAYINICSDGLDSLPAKMEDLDPSHMETAHIKEIFDEYGKELLGIKIRTSTPIVGKGNLEPLKATVKVADQVGVPVMVHITNPPTTMDDLLDYMRPGDVITHMYQNKGHCILDRETGKIMEAAWKARERGVIFEAADAREHFSFEVSEPAIAQGFFPDYIATDLTKYSMHLRPTVFNLAMQISKYCRIGMSFSHVIQCCTWFPAVGMGLSDTIGSIAEGKEADIAVFRPTEMQNIFGDRPFTNQEATLREGNFVYQPVLTVKAGEMVYRDVTF